MTLYKAMAIELKEIQRRVSRSLEHLEKLSRKDEELDPNYTVIKIPKDGKRYSVHRYEDGSMTTEVYANSGAAADIGNQPFHTVDWHGDSDGGTESYEEPASVELGTLPDPPCSWAYPDECPQHGTPRIRIGENESLMDIAYLREFYGEDAQFIFKPGRCCYPSNGWGHTIPCSRVPSRQPYGTGISSRDAVANVQANVQANVDQIRKVIQGMDFSALQSILRQVGYSVKTTTTKITMPDDYTYTATEGDMGQTVLTTKPEKPCDFTRAHVSHGWMEHTANTHKPFLCPGIQIGREHD